MPYRVEMHKGKWYVYNTEDYLVFHGTWREVEHFLDWSDNQQPKAA